MEGMFRETGVPEPKYPWCEMWQPKLITQMNNHKVEMLQAITGKYEA